MAEEISVGKKFDFGTIVLSEQEIIDFAKVFDPLDFHTDVEIAKKSIFKGLIASGPHIFNYVYKKEWIPRFGKTVICGTGISYWKFIKPVYPGQKIHSELTVVSMTPNLLIGGTTITWLLEFKNEEGAMVQVLQMEIMHNLDSV